jgi:hypothetical protein
MTIISNEEQKKIMEQFKYFGKVLKGDVTCEFYVRHSLEILNEEENVSPFREEWRLKLFYQLLTILGQKERQRVIS